MRSKLFKVVKMVSILLVVFIMFSLAGCGKTEKDNDSKGSKTGSEKEPDSENKEEKVYTIDWNGLQYGPVKDDAPVKKILEEKFNVKFNMIYVDRSKYLELMNLKFANNEIPDVFTALNVNTLIQWVDQDLLAEIPESFIREHAPNIAKEIDSYKKYDEKVWKFSLVDGKNYGILAHNADMVYHSPVIWRNDWLKNVGINKLPETLAEFETALYKFAKEDPDKNGKPDTYGLSADGFNAIYGTSGYWPTFWNKKGNEVVWGGIQPEIKQVLATLNKWYKDGVIDPEFVTGENQGGYWAISHAFVNGRIGMTARGNYYHWNYPYYEGEPGGVGNYENFVKIQPKTASYAFGRPAIGADGKTGMGIGGVISHFCVFGKQLEKDPDKLARILKILDALASDYDLYLNAKYGIEGQHWDYTAQKEPWFKDEFKSVEAQASIGAGNAFLPWQSMDFYRKLRPFHFAFAEKSVNYEKYVNQVPVGLPSSGKYKADLDKLQEQTFMKIITGDQSIDSFDTFVDQWNKMGGEQLTKEANDWYKSVTSGN
ncbi:MAG: ABC transporter substrate-binding protein [Firmicutes bacterium]|nr:ABC transporter substrate-binding protein [Bacillota bacterium]